MTSTFRPSSTVGDPALDGIIEPPRSKRTATRFFASLAVTLFLVAGLPLVTATAAQASVCSGTSGVTVVVEYQGAVSVGCTSGDPGSGLAALQALHSVAFVPRQPGLVCTIGGDPNPCNGAPVNAYWSYWHWQNGGWAYSTSGAGSYHPAPGSIEGWSFGAGSPPDVKMVTVVPPTTLATASHASQPATTPAKPAVPARPTVPTGPTVPARPTVPTGPASTRKQPATIPPTSQASTAAPVGTTTAHALTSTHSPDLTTTPTTAAGSATTGSASPVGVPTGTTSSTSPTPTSSTGTTCASTTSTTPTSRSTSKSPATTTPRSTTSAPTTASAPSTRSSCDTPASSTSQPSSSTPIDGRSGIAAVIVGDSTAPPNATTGPTAAASSASPSSNSGTIWSFAIGGIVILAIGGAAVFRVHRSRS